MEENKSVNINLSSKMVEKAIDVAKDFLDKLITPTVEEVGLLLKDQVTLWRFTNQVKLLTKTKAVCERNGIIPKTISLKLLYPLLENASLEEDDFLQDKWSILLSNLVDSDQNIENHVFPYILGQISKNEYFFVEKTYLEKKERVKKISNELSEFILTRPFQEKIFQSEIQSLKDKIEKLKTENKYLELQDARVTLSSKEWALSSLKYKENGFNYQIKRPEVFLETEIKEYELSNLIRLGIAKAVQENIANSQTLEIPNKPDQDYLTVDVDIEVESNIEHVLTELGELFMDACTEKAFKNKTTLN